jgi:integrase
MIRLEHRSTRKSKPEVKEARIHQLRFHPVFDSRKHRVRGLWRRGKRYYGQLRMIGPDGSTSKPKKISLGIVPLDVARAELERVRTENRSGALALPGRVPTFADFADEYLASVVHAHKRPSTRKSERLGVGYWKNHLGAVQLKRINAPMVKAYFESRLAKGLSARTINIELVVFNAVMKFAVDRGIISDFPHVSRLPQKPPPKRPLLSAEEIGRLLAACTPKVTKNSELLKFYIRFLVLTGAREKEALRVQWDDVDLANRQVTIGASGDSKSGHYRRVNMTSELGALVVEMSENRQPDSSFLFPSPQRDPKDIHARSLRESFRLVRQKARLPRVGFHDLRHFFASQCVMSGCDFMTISQWLGHQDGGILVGRVYGHLSDQHRSRMADGLSILKPPANVVPGRFKSA